MIGQTISHYEIVDKLGEGGMGVVYRARDTKLRREVALKVLPEAMASDAGRLERFKREARALAALDHPNIVTIHTVEEVDGINFLTMSLVQGDSLEDIIPENGLPQERFFDLATQLADALAAAHDKGIAHRDLKPANVMVSDDGRVRILDFGLAKLVESSTSGTEETLLATETMTRTGLIVGTIPYMSPEQVESKPIDHRTDIFSLGVLLYEMACGKRPFRAESAPALMSAILKDTPRPVTDVRDVLPRHLGRILQHCLEKNPEHRFQSAKDVRNELQALEQELASGVELVSSWAASRSPLFGPRTRWAIGVALLGAAAVVTAGLYWLPQLEHELTIGTPAAAAEVTSLAVLPFQNASGDEELDWLSGGLADMLLIDVGESPHVRAVSGDRLYQVLKDLRISTGESLEPSTRRRVAEFCSAQTLVWGRFVKLGDQIRIDATVENLVQDRQAPLKVEAAGEHELLSAIGRLAGLVREDLARSNESLGRSEARVFQPSSDSVAALRSYSQGRELLRQGKNLEAVAHFERSVIEDPGFAIAHSKLAEALHLTGHGQDADARSRRALALSEGLPVEERKLIVAVDARIHNDLDKAVEAYESLLELRPEDPDLHYELGSLHERAGLLDKALEHFTRALASDAQNPSALLGGGRVLAAKGNAEAALEPLNQALMLAVKAGNQEMESKVAQSLGNTYRQLDRLADALHYLERSLEIRRALADQRGTAESLDSIAWVQDLSGDFDEARASYQKAIQGWRNLGDQWGLSISLMNLGDMERLLGNYDESLKLTREALQIQIDRNDEFNQGLALNNIGATYYLQGKYGDALVYYQRALEIRESLDLPGEIADTLHNMGEIYETTGHFDRATDHYLRAVELRRDSGDARGAALESAAMGRVFAAQGRYGDALEATGEATGVFRDLGDRSRWSTEILAWHGQILGLLGQDQDAIPILEEATLLAERWEDPWLLALVLGFKGESSLYAGDVEGASVAFRRALTLATDSGDPFLELTSRINLGRVSTALGDSRAALAVLEAACGRAAELGLRVLASKCALHREIARLSSGDREGGLGGLRQAIEDGEKLIPADLRASAHALLAEVLRQGGNEVAATEHASAAQQLLDEVRREAGTDSLLGRADLVGVLDLSTGGTGTDL